MNGLIYECVKRMNAFKLSKSLKFLRTKILNTIKIKMKNNNMEVEI